MSEIQKCPVCLGSKIEAGMGGMHKSCTHCKAVGYINVSESPSVSNDDEIKQLREDRLLLLESLEDAQKEIEALKQQLEKASIETPKKSKKAK